MANVATPIEVRQIGIAKESVTRGTAPAAPVNFLSATKDSNIDFATKLIKDPALRGVNAAYPSFPGIQEGKGPFKTPFRAQNAGEFLNMAIGAPVSVEQNYITIVTGTNDTLDLTDNVTIVAGVIAAGSYPMGSDNTVAGSFCKALKTALDAVATGGATYTVAFAAGVLTITRSTATFKFLFGTGTNKAKSPYAAMGFAAADSVAAITQASTVTLYAPFKHTFTTGQITQLPSYAFYIDRGTFNAGAKDIKVYNLGSVQKLKLSGVAGAPVELEASLLAQKEATYGGAWSPAFTGTSAESPVLMFNNVTVKVAGSASSVPNVKSWDIELDPGMVEFRPQAQIQYAYDFLAAGPYMASGSMAVYFMDEVERAKFLAASQTSIEILIAGSAIGATSQLYTLDILLPYVEYEAFPFGEEDKFLGAAIKFNVPYSAVPAFLAQVYLINSRSAY